jgi:4-methylaminobutanoate oxidase (formaldehyde-forming)
LTVTCIEKNFFRVVSGAAVRSHDKKHILNNLKYDVEFSDITENFACLGLFGPKSRDLLTDLAGDKFNTEQFPFGSGKFLTVEGISIWFQRLSYVGELGWEVYIPIHNSKKIYDTIIEIGKTYQLIHAGAHAMDIMRMEKMYLHWGHDISPEENPYEAGLGFAVSLNKEQDFIGKNALKKIDQNQLTKKLCMFTLEKSEPGKPLLLHEEPIYLEGTIIGQTTSGNYSFNFNKNMSFGYINNYHLLNDLKNKTCEIEVAKKKYKVNLEFQALHDPKNIMIKA